MTAWTLGEAKNRFSAVVEAALRGEPQEVTRRGVPAVVVIAASDYARLKSTRGDFARHLLAIPRGGEEDPFRRDGTFAPRDVAF